MFGTGAALVRQSKGLTRVGVDRTDNRTDSGAEDKPSAGPRVWRPPPDRPGSPGQPSRLESKAAAAGRGAPAEQRDDEQPPPAAGKPEAGAEKDTTDDSRSRDDRPLPAAPGKESGQEADEDPGESGDALTTEGRSGERPGGAAEEDTEGESGDARGKDAGPEPEDESKDSSGTDVWEEFASKSATYESQGLQFGFRTWGEEFEARRASREALRQRTETGSVETQAESAVRDETPSEGQKNAADAGTDRTDGDTVGSGDTAEADAESAEKDDLGAGAVDTEITDAEVADQGDAWREHVDSMRAKWSDLESEQTPDRPPEQGDEGRSPQGEGASEGAEDLSGDESGSWRGDGGQYLNLEENHAVGRSFERVRDQETDVTDTLKTGEIEVPNAKLVGLEYRMKGEDRFKEKAAEQLAAEFREDPTRAAESIPDALRYTYQIPADEYTQGYYELTEKLADDGYEMVFSRNSWDTPVYKGVNTRWKTPGGQLFEVQFHTPESFEAKQLTHAAYERRRSPQVGDLEAEMLDDFQREVSAGIPMPKNVSEIASFRREG